MAVLRVEHLPAEISLTLCDQFLAIFATFCAAQGALGDTGTPQEA